MVNSRTKRAILAAVGALLLPVTSHSIPVLARTPVPTRVQPTPAAEDTTGNDTRLYQKAKTELPTDFYVLYRIVDRISRANQLDNQPWQVEIVPRYDVNAFATTVNQISVFNGLVERVAGDTSALACLVGREMAHHLKGHTAISEAEKTAILEQVRQQARTEAIARFSEPNPDRNVVAVGRRILGKFGGTLGKIGGLVIDGITGDRVEEDEQSFEQRVSQEVEAIVSQKQAELDRRIAEETRQRELAADEAGYLYMVRARFEPNGCLRLMDAIAQLPQSHADRNLLALPDRIEALKTSIAKSSRDRLTREGQTRIETTEPLTYELSRDGNSVRIHSRKGSSQTDLERLFGQ